MALWATWSSWRCPHSLQGCWARWPLRSLPTRSILWFYDNLHLLNYSIILHGVCAQSKTFPTLIWVSKWSKDVKRSSGNGKKSVILYIRNFLISFVFVHEYRRPGLSSCLSMLYLNHMFLSCLTVLPPQSLPLSSNFTASQLRAFVHNDPNHFLSFQKGKKEHNAHPFLDSSHVHSWICTLGRQLGRTQQRAAGSRQVLEALSQVCHGKSKCAIIGQGTG